MFKYLKMSANDAAKALYFTFRHSILNRNTCLNSTRCALFEIFEKKVKKIRFFEGKFDEKYLFFLYNT